LSGIRTARGWHGCPHKAGGVGALGLKGSLRSFSKARGEELNSSRMTGGSDSNAVPDEEVNCLMLHPVGWPNHGPEIELYLAEEAIGLVKSMDWQVAKGPMWDTTSDLGGENGHLSSEEENESDEESNHQRKRLREAFEDGQPRTFSTTANLRQFRKENIQNGDYVYGPDVQGVFYQGGVVLDLDEDESLQEEDEWRDANLRESVARSSLIRCRKISSTNFFTKGKLNELGLYIKETRDINAIFINSSLTAIQIKKLEKRWNDIIMGREDRVRQYYLKNVQKEHEISPTESDTSTAMSDFGGYDSQNYRKIRVIDRFGMIL